MGRIYNSMVNNWSGTVGGMVFYMFRKKQCVRSLPSHYRDANTIVQQRNRKRFSLVSQTLSPLKEVLKIGYRYGFENMTAWNAAAKKNTLSAFEFDEQREEYVFRPEKLLVTYGKVAQARSPLMITSERRILVSWSNLAGCASQYFRPSDHPMLTVYNAHRKEVWHEICPTRRDALLCETQVPSCWVGEPMWVYLSFLTNSEVPRVSISQYLGMLNEPSSLLLTAPSGPAHLSSPDPQRPLSPAPSLGASSPDSPLSSYPSNSATTDSTPAPSPIGTPSPDGFPTPCFPALSPLSTTSLPLPGMRSNTPLEGLWSSEIIAKAPSGGTPPETRRHPPD